MAKPEAKHIDADVMKALSPEEATMLSNVQSIIGEILQGGQPAPVAEAAPGVVKAEDNMDTTEELETAIDEDKSEKKKSVKKNWNVSW